MLARACPVLLAAVLLCSVRADDKAPPPEDPAKKCDMTRQEIGWKCVKCGKIYPDGKLEQNECPDCKAEVKSIPCCVKVGYACAADQVCVLEEGDCPKCGKKLEAKTVYSEIYYRCVKCGGRDPSGRPGECPTCKVFRVKTCALSGTCPHLPTPKKKDEKEGK